MYDSTWSRDGEKVSLFWQGICQKFKGVSEMIVGEIIVTREIIAPGPETVRKYMQIVVYTKTINNRESVTNT